MTTVSSTASTASTASAASGGSGLVSQGPIASPGLGSGLDVSSIVNSLMAVDSQPLTLLQQQATTINTEISAYGQLSSLTSAMGDAANTLSSVSLWNSVVPTSSNSSAVTASATDGATAANYAVTVQALASGQTVSSAAVSSSSATLSTGTLTIQLGSYSGSGSGATFTPQSGSSPTAINIPSSDTSLTSIAADINAANAGVSATIINDASGARLALTSTATGTSNAFQITASNVGGAGSSGSSLSALAYDATAASSPMTLNQTAQNAAATVNGIAVTSQSNTLTGIADGLTMNLLQASSTPVTVSVSPDTTSITNDVNAFVSAYNALNSYIQTSTAYNSSTGQAGTLQGDFTTVNLLNQMRNVINQPTSASSVFTSLSQIGIQVQDDGSLSVDSTKFSAALGNLPELQKVLAANTGSASSSGYITNFSNLASQVLEPPSGSIASGTSSLQSMLQDNSSQQASMQTRLAAVKASLLAQYQALDSTVAQNQSLGSLMSSSLAGIASSSAAASPAPAPAASNSSSTSSSS